VRLEPGSPAAHVREHHGLLAAAEKRVLVWLAERMPPAINSDHLTALGMVAMLLAGGAFALVPWWRPVLAFVPLCLALNWFGDSLDGTLARVRGQQRPRYGYYVDHVVDIVNVTALFAGLACSGLIGPALAVGVLAAYVAVCAEVFLATHVLGVFPLSFIGFGPTELRIVLSVGALAAIRTPVVALPGLDGVGLFDLGAVIALGGMAAAFTTSAIRHTRRLYRLEPIPRGAR
jgi:archaetidylinositol phosphate synthase